jgi:hypothetical protein
MTRVNPFVVVRSSKTGPDGCRVIFITRTNDVPSSSRDEGPDLAAGPFVVLMCC